MSSMLPCQDFDNENESRSFENDDFRIRENVDSVESKVYASKKLASFFELEVTLKIFGRVIWHWVFPPKD